MEPTELYRRLEGVLNPERLRNRPVLVAGLGSGGCRVAAELGRIGVPLILVDRPGELLLEHNIIRHLLGYRSLGKSKLSEMADYVHNLNPSTPVDCRELDVVEDQAELAATLESVRPGLIAVCTDNEESKHALNAAGIRAGVPQVGAGVFDGGVGGEVYVVRPGQACYGCIASHTQFGRRTARRGLDIDYSHPDIDELRSTCALNADIQQIALLQSRIALHLLLDGTPDLIGLPPTVNLCVFANRVVPGVFDRPWHADFYVVNNRADCLDCSDGGANVEEEAASILDSLRAGRERQSVKDERP